MVKIYTRKADDEHTRPIAGEAVSKDEVRLEALGCIDELVAFLGLARSEIAHPEIASRLTVIQSDLYLMLGDIASSAQAWLVAGKLSNDAVDVLQSVIDGYESRLPPLRDFVMPGETRGSSTLHVARTVCRRAERRVMAAAGEFLPGKRVSAYLNRLSDFLFVAARLVDHEEGRADRTFKSVL